MIQEIDFQYLLPALITAIVAIVIAYLITRRQMFHPALEYVQNEYRRPEMLDALRSLWNLYDTNTRENMMNGTNRSVADAYRRRYEIEQQLINQLEAEVNNIKGRIQQHHGSTRTLRRELQDVRSTIATITNNSIDNKRRLVSHFFAHLDALLENGILTENQIRLTFPSAAETLRSISIPLEEKLVDIICDGRFGITDEQRRERKRISILNLQRILRILESRRTILNVSTTINEHSRTLINWRQ